MRLRASKSLRRVRAGESIRLVTHLSVTGGSLVEVTELRQIYFEDRGLFSQPRLATSALTASVHQSVLSFEVPAVAKPGVYRYEVLIRTPGQEQRKDTLFEIY